MDSKTRIKMAWEGKEPDRVPIEMFINPRSVQRDLPGAQKVLEFQRTEADNFMGATLFDWGFIGLDAKYEEQTVEDVKDAYKRIKKTVHTPVGEFTAITRHTYSDLYGWGDESDYHWEKRFIETLDDFRRIATVERNIRACDVQAYNRACEKIGGRGMPQTSVLHPLGTLVRNSNMENIYGWMLSEKEMMMEFLEKSTRQVCDSLSVLQKASLVDPPVFKTHALEMFIPPWFGHKHFDTFVFPFDRQINRMIQSVGGRHFAHCHGNSGTFLQKFADMGIEALDPLEPPPYGDNDLKKAKECVGNRMLLCGNIPSQAFSLDSFRVEDVREMVRAAIQDGAPGGRFMLRTTGSAYVGYGKTKDQREKSIQCGLAMIKAWREFGEYA